MFCSYFQVSVFIKLPFPPGKVTATDVTKTVNNLFEKMSLSIFKWLSRYLQGETEEKYKKKNLHQRSWPSCREWDPRP